MQRQPSSCKTPVPSRRIQHKAGPGYTKEVPNQFSGGCFGRFVVFFKCTYCCMTFKTPILDGTFKVEKIEGIYVERQEFSPSVKFLSAVSQRFIGKFSRRKPGFKQTKEGLKSPGRRATRKARSERWSDNARQWVPTPQSLEPHRSYFTTRQSWHSRARSYAGGAEDRAAR